MRDQAFNPASLYRVIGPKDRKNEPALSDYNKLGAILSYSSNLAHSTLAGQNPFRRVLVKSKNAYVVTSVPHSLIIRKLRENINSVVRPQTPSRDFIISNLTHFLSEGVPYRLYRLDIQNFYESFSTDAVIETADRLRGLSPLSKKLIRALLEFFSTLGGTGVPRGLSLSSTLSDMMMSAFDMSVRRDPAVYLYYRYVNDMVVLTKDDHNGHDFLKRLSGRLPPSLTFHAGKRTICDARTAKLPKNTAPSAFQFEFLGYRFSVSGPNVRPEDRRHAHRDVEIDIASAKVKKIKSRVSRAFLSFSRNRNFRLLHLRVTYLTSNICVKDPNRNTYKLSGIFFNYPRVTAIAGGGLSELDHFLRKAVTSTRGRLFSMTSMHLTSGQKRLLLKHSFVRGHSQRVFKHFSPSDRQAVLRCWRHA